LHGIVFTIDIPFNVFNRVFDDNNEEEEEEDALFMFMSIANAPFVVKSSAIFYLFFGRTSIVKAS